MTKRINPIETGQTFPGGAKLYPGGSCAQCGRQDNVARVMLVIFGQQTPPKRVCAECLADFACVPDEVACETWVECTDGQLRQIGADRTGARRETYGQSVPVGHAPAPSAEDEKAAAAAAALSAQHRAARRRQEPLPTLRPAILLRYDRPPELVRDFDASLEGLQAAVGGFIGLHGFHPAVLHELQKRFGATLGDPMRVRLVVDDDGLSKALPYNSLATYVYNGPPAELTREPVMVVGHAVLVEVE